MHGTVPGGGEFGRGLRADVRNPVLRLPAMQEILALPPDAPISRRQVGLIVRQLADQANAEAVRSQRKNKHMMVAYWKVASVYAKHVARAIDPTTTRKRSVSEHSANVS